MRFLRGQGYAPPAAWRDDTNYIESIAAGSWYSQFDEALSALVADEGTPSLGHRRHLMGIDGFYAEDREIGVGLASNDQSTYGHYWAVHIARREPATPFVTGVAYQDANGNSRYDAGEGLAGVRIRIGGSTAITNEAGGYSLPAAADHHYRAVASGGGLASPATANVRVAAENVELDFTSGKNQLC